MPLRSSCPLICTNIYWDGNDGKNSGTPLGGNTAALLVQPRIPERVWDLPRASLV